jgi:hypothetical protein
MKIGSTVISNFKKLHELDEESIRVSLGEHLPRWCLSGNSLVYDITDTVKEARDYQLYKLLGFDTFEDYCTKKLNATSD